MDNMIQLKGDFQRKELAAAGTITPGMLVERDSSDEFAFHSGEGEPHGSAFAVEDELQGNDIDDDYLIGVRVQVNYQQKGNEVMAWLAPDLAGTPIVIGSFLESHGDGDLVVAAGSDRQTVGVALEAIDLTASGDVRARIKIEIT